MDTPVNPFFHRFAFLRADPFENSYGWAGLGVGARLW